jgi:glycine cleavage system H protein
MSDNIPNELRYTDEHEWARQDGDLIVIGITDHAQAQLGDVVFLELPEVGSTLEKGKALGVVESVKAVSDLYAPLTGEVVEINDSLIDSPEGVNLDPYGEAWMIKIRPEDPAAWSTLMDATAYAELLKAE